MKKLILLLGVLVSVFFIGCTSSTASKNMSINKVRFQSVSNKEAIILQKGKEKDSCVICGMNLAKFYKTNHAADTKEGTKQYCSIHCVIKDNEINKTDLKNLRVVDVASLQFIPALNAYYVVGSSKPATMSSISKYAFKNKVDADKFAKDFGGKVMKFYDAYDIGGKDFTQKR